MSSNKSPEIDLDLNNHGINNKSSEPLDLSSNSSTISQHCTGDSADCRPACSGITKHMRQVLAHYKTLRGQSCKDQLGRSMWDAVVISTGDQAQRAAFQQQIQHKHQRRELPTHLPIHVVADPPGPKIGNGGSTLVALEHLHSLYGDQLYQLKVLLVHAGGWSQRMPSASLLGKIFSAIPHGRPLLQMLDLKLALYLPFVPRIAPGVFLVCADDFLVYDLAGRSPWAIPERGFTALAHPSPVKVGHTHGVYVPENAGKLDRSQSVVVTKCLQVLQKPSDQRLKDAGALIFSDSERFQFADGVTVEGKEAVYTDSCFYFGVDVVKKLLKLKKDLGDVDCEIDAYGDFLQALGPRATEDYVSNVKNVSRVTPNLIPTRRRVFHAMRECDLHLLVLHASKFIHIGTTLELLQHYCLDEEFRRQMDLTRDAFNSWLPGEGKSLGNSDCSAERQVGDILQRGDESLGSSDLSAKYQTAENLLGGGESLGNSGLSPQFESVQGCVMHSVLLASSRLSPASLLEYCHFDVPITVGDNSIVSCCQWRRGDDQPPSSPSSLPGNTSPSTLPGNTSSLSELSLPPDTFLHTVSIRHQAEPQYVTVFFRISDNLKKSCPASEMASLPFLGSTVGSALKLWALGRDVALADAHPDSPTSLWNLRLYPGARSMTASLRLALEMMSSVRENLPPAQEVGRRDWDFFSLADILAKKDVSAMLDFRTQLFERIQAAESKP